MTSPVALSRFHQRYGRTESVRWRAPGRINLIGEHTDYNDGFVLPLALRLGTTVAAAARDDRRLVVASLQAPDEDVVVDLDDLAPGAVTGWASYVAGTAWALAGAGIELPGVDLLVDGDLPRGAGLSSSASLECATAGALLDLSGTTLPDERVALLAQRAENDFVGMPCGVMDQVAATRARAGHVLLLDTRSLAVEQIPFDLEAGGLALLVVDTRAPHRLVDGDYAARRRACEEAAALLGVRALRDVDDSDLDQTLARLSDPVLRRRVRHVVTENARVLEVASLLRAGDRRGIGPLLTASHVSLRDDYEVSCSELDLVVGSALAAGALGARMTGGGFGGSAIALVDADRAGLVRDRILQAFAAAGLGEPGFVAAIPSDGYGRTA